MIKKSIGTAYLLWAIGAFGLLGFHRFYLSRTGTGIIWILTGGVVVVGAIVDLFLIPKMVNDYNSGKRHIDTNINKDDD